jgi:hypothetical protein
MNRRFELRCLLGLRVVENPEKGGKMFHRDVFEKNRVGILSALRWLPSQLASEVTGFPFKKIPVDSEMHVFDLY